MSDSGNNSLSPRDIENVLRLVLGFTAAFSYHRGKYTPEESAANMLQGLTEQKMIAFQHIFSLILEDSLPQQPKEINRTIANRLQQGSEVDKGDLTVSDGQDSWWDLSSSLLSKVLKQLTPNILQHGMKQPRLPGRPATHDLRSERPGRPSSYVENADSKSLRATLAKSEARNMVYHILAKTNVLYEYGKFMRLVQMYTVRKSENLVQLLNKADPNSSANTVVRELRETVMKFGADEMEIEAGKWAIRKMEDPSSLVDDSLILTASPPISDSPNSYNS
jgi:hypothetical protein